MVIAGRWRAESKCWRQAEDSAVPRHRQGTSLHQRRLQMLHRGLSRLKPLTPFSELARAQDAGCA